MANVFRRFRRRPAPTQTRPVDYKATAELIMRAFEAVQRDSGRPDLTNGRPASYPGTARTRHMNHVHWAAEECPRG